MIPNEIPKIERYEDFLPFHDWLLQHLDGKKLSGGDQKMKTSTHILRRDGTQPKLGLHRKNSPSSADFYHLQLPQM
jgi:hypothetical protein